MGGAVNTRVDAGLGLDFRDTANLITQIGKEFHMRGWTLGTSGNFSAVLCREPLRLMITATGADMSHIAPRQIVQVDAAGAVVGGVGRSSATAGWAEKIRARVFDIVY